MTHNLTYILSSLKSRRLGSLLSLVLIAFGVSMALIIVLFTSHVEKRLSQDSQNIDLVIGSKGSPLQIILSSVYHIDIPTGNILWDDAKKWIKHPQVKQAVPLALGDNWNGHRIVGTTVNYLDLYGAKISNGVICDHEFEAVIGSDINLIIGDTFSGAHGLMNGGHVHDNEQYEVVGKLKKTGTVLDRLILTSLDSVLKVHGLEGVEEEDDHEEEHHHHDHHDESEHNEKVREPKITALLLQTRSPMANMNLPHVINKEGQLQAANPALEMSRLTSMLGVGTKTLSLISMALMIMACFSIFAGIAGTLENRKTDLAILRALGYSRNRIFKIIAGEGLCLVVMGSIIGAVLSFVGFTILIEAIPSLNASGASYHFIPEMLYIYGGALFAGFLASFIPAYRAAKVDVVKQLN